MFFIYLALSENLFVNSLPSDPLKQGKTISRIYKNIILPLLSKSDSIIHERNPYLNLTIHLSY